MEFRRFHFRPAHTQRPKPAVCVPHRQPSIRKSHDRALAARDAEQSNRHRPRTTGGGRAGRLRSWAGTPALSIGDMFSRNPINFKMLSGQCDRCACTHIGWLMCRRLPFTLVAGFYAAAQQQIKCNMRALVEHASPTYAPHKYIVFITIYIYICDVEICCARPNVCCGKCSIHVC